MWAGKVPMASRHWLMFLLPLFGLISFCAVFKLECVSFVKDVYRLVRSEAHLAVFNYQLASSGAIPSSKPLISPSEPGLLYIAHGTGQVAGLPARNSLQGFNASFKNGCRLIEADFEWTRDGYLVSTHDWFTFFGEPLREVPDLKEFVNRPRSDGFKQLTFNDIDAWLISYPLARLVTDVKANNLEALKIFRRAKSYEQIIPQTYSYAQFLAAKKLGFKDVILTTYMTYYSESSLRRFGEIIRPSALTVPVFRLTPELIASMRQLDIPVFVHPVPARTDLEMLPMGVKGIYSSTLCV